MTAEIIRNSVTPSDHDFFDNAYPHLVATDDCIRIRYDADGGIVEEELVIFKTRPGYKAWTPYGAARKAGKYIVKAACSRFIKFDFNGNLVSNDAEDDSTDR